MAQPTSSLFFSTRAARIEHARRRYFDDGIAPAGVVSDTVFESWARCQRLHASPAGSVVFQPVTKSRTQLSLQKNHHLMDAWYAELHSLETVLGPTSCAAMLIDASGVLVGAACAGRSHERIMPIATRLGVDLSEDAVGTTAPGVAARTGQSLRVLGAEHYFDDVRDMNCAAAPIRDIRGRIAGALDISSEAVPFGFDAASIVDLFASAIENRLLLTQSREHLVVHFQVAAPLLDSPFVGLVGIDADGRVVWCNATASKLLGLTTLDDAPSPSAEAQFGARLSMIASLPSAGASAMTLPNGLVVRARASMRAPDGRRHLVDVPCTGERIAATATGEQVEASVKSAATDKLQEVAADPPNPNPNPTLHPVAASGEAAMPGGATTSLRHSDCELIEQALKECGGNITRAAKRLGVSRGLIYRRLQGRARLSSVSACQPAPAARSAPQAT